MGTPEVDCSFREASRMIRQLLGAVNYVHCQGVVRLAPTLSWSVPWSRVFQRLARRSRAGMSDCWQDRCSIGSATVSSATPGIRGRRAAALGVGEHWLEAVRASALLDRWCCKRDPEWGSFGPVGGGCASGGEAVPRSRGHACYF